MTPKEILSQWVDAFNNADVETISELYDDNAINHQVANEPVIGKEAIKKMFEQDFSFPEMGNDSNLLIVFYVQIMPDDFVM
ncbi:YybH family protein, partial [Klebsiella michiganensis]